MCLCCRRGYDKMRVPAHECLPRLDLVLLVAKLSSEWQIHQDHAPCLETLTKRPPLSARQVPWCELCWVANFVASLLEEGAARISNGILDTRGAGFRVSLHPSRIRNMGTLNMLMYVVMTWNTCFPDSYNNTEDIR